MIDFLKRIFSGFSYRTRGVEALNKAVEVFTFHTETSFEDVMANGISPIADAIGLDRVVIYNRLRTDKTKFGQSYQWDKTIGGTIFSGEPLKILPPIPAVMQWLDISLKGKCVVRRLDKMSKDEAAFSNMFGIKSVVLVPIFTHDEFWGAVAFQDRTKERDFEGSLDLLCSVARLCVNAIIRNEFMRSTKEAIETIERQKKMADTLNKSAVIFISQNEEAFEAKMTAGVRLVCDMADVDRFSIFRNSTTPEGLFCSQVYRWDRESGGTTKPTAIFERIAATQFAPNWEKFMKNGEIINGSLKSMPEYTALHQFGIVSVLVVPLFIENAFWGFGFFEDRHKERYFEDDYVEIMRSATFLCASIFIRVEMERKIAEANELNRSLLNSAPISIITYDEYMNVLDCNDVTLKIFGCEKQRFMEHFYDFSPEYQPDGLKSRNKAIMLMEHVLNGETQVFEWAHISFSGETIPCEVTLTRANYKGKAGALAYVYDLRNYKKLMDSIHEQNQLLTFRLNWQKLLSEISKDFISYGDPYTLINEALGKLGNNLGVSRMFIFYINYESYDTHAVCQWYADYDTPKLRNERNLDLFKMFKTVFPKDLPEGIAAPIISCPNVTTSPDENFRTLETADVTSFICAPLYIEGSLWGIVTAENCFTPYEWSEDEVSFFAMTSSIIAGAIMRNIYDIKLKETLNKVTNLNKAKDEFLSKISHEIRTPMNAILGITEIQLQNENLPRETKEGLGIIYNSGNSLLRIINDLLDLSKIDAKKLEITPVNYEIAGMISDTVQLNKIRIESKPIEFKLHLDENIPAVLFGDELRIKQILNNILSNAFKYTSKGEVSMSISVEKNESEDFDVTLVFRVNDTGQGMTKEQVDKIFDQYVRFNLTSNRSIEGTGLGMTITRGLIELMNGDISVESEPNKGSVFTVRLPQKSIGTEVLDREMVENLQKFRINPLSQMKKKQFVRKSMPYGKIMVVDDVESNLYVAEHLLAPYNLSLETAMSGFEAIEKIKSGRVYDIIFMDHMMPEMDGIEAVRIIRESGYTHPIIALTANAITGQAEIFLKNGFNGFISKPIDVYQLNNELNKFIRDKNSSEAIAKAGGQKGETQTVREADAALHLVFARDAKKALPVFESILKNIESASDDDLHLFVIKAHAMKSALASIGEDTLSQTSSALEEAGKTRDKNTIVQKTQGLIDALKSIIEKNKVQQQTANSDENTAYLSEQLKIISDACANYNAKNAESTIMNLRKMPWSKETENFLDEISEYLLHSDFEEAGALVAHFRLSK